MTAHELKRIFQKGECLSLETMKLYAEGKLEKKSAHVVEEHLLECGLCSGAMEGLNSKRIAEVTKLSSHIQRRLSVYMNNPPRIPFFRRYGFSIVAGLIFLGGGSTAIYLVTRKSPEEQRIADSAKAAIDRQLQTSIGPGHDANNNIVPSSNSPAITSSNNNSSNTRIADNYNTDRATATTFQDLPATQPGKDNTFTVNPQQGNNDRTQNNSNSDGSSSRNANNTTPVRVKSVIAYPPVTHDDGKSGRKSSTDGQLSRSDAGSANFRQEDMPSYPGGDAAMRNYITNNFKPQNLDRNLLTRYTNGAIVTINSKTGTVTNVELSFSLNKALDDEFIRVLKSMPLWNPGKKRGEVDVMVGITFE